jgi:glycosyltransferase involved in cell wall biosynthesis
VTQGTQPRLILLVRSLGRGGAERQLVALAKGLRSSVDVRVLTFYPDGVFAGELLRNGIAVYSMDKKGRWDLPGFWLRLSATVNHLRPEIVYSFLPVPNIVASALRLRRPDLRLAWGVRASDMDLAPYGLIPRSIFAASRVAARAADVIIANSHAGRSYHIACGYPADRVVVIPNGIDTESFKPDATARHRMRARLGVADGEPLVGLVARLDPVKGHELFLQTAARLRSQRSNLRFLCVGDGDIEYRQKLMAQCRSIGLGDKVTWLGDTHDMPGVYNALDVLCSSSQSEGFSNVIAEAMATGIRCAATPAGDAAAVIGDCGVVSAGHQVEMLEQAVCDALAMNPESVATRARDRITRLFSVSAMVRQTHDVLFGTVASSPRQAASAVEHANA